MVGTRDLHRLVSLAGAKEAKVVLVGDPAQLPEIAAGGSFARLTACTPSYVLAANRRQVGKWERAALDQLRDRHPAPALARYGQAGRITLADTAPELRAQMAADWYTAWRDGRSVIMLAVRRADVADLNRHAQARLIAAGALEPGGPHVDLGAGQRALVGDEVACGRNDRRAGLINGTRLTVTGIDPDTHTITGTGTGTDDGRTAVVPGAYVDQGRVALAYASTVHKAQGRTVDRTLLLGDDRLYAEAGYVGLSRGRQHNQLYVVADHRPLTPAATPGSGLVDHLCDALSVSRAQTLSTGHVTDRVPDAPLPALVAERDHLRDRLLATMPRPATPDDRSGVAGQAVRDRGPWTAEHRRDGERLARLAAVIDPPGHLTRLLGPVPDHPAGARRWATTAARVEAWRELAGRDPDRGPRHLLAEPAREGPEHAWWQQATRAVDAHQARHLDHDPVRRDHDRGRSR